MSHLVKVFPITSSLTTSGLVVAGLPMIRLHGWVFEEAGTAAGIVEFRSHIAADGNQLPTPVVPTITDTLIFNRSIAVGGADMPPWFAEQGLFLPGGLFLDLKTGTAAITGSIFYS